MGPGLLFLVAGTTDTKFRRSTGVTTANSTNKNPNANKLSWVINYLVTIVIVLLLILFPGCLLCGLVWIEGLSSAVCLGLVSG